MKKYFVGYVKWWQWNWHWNKMFNKNCRQNTITEAYDFITSTSIIFTFHRVFLCHCIHNNQSISSAHCVIKQDIMRWPTTIFSSIFVTLLQVIQGFSLLLGIMYIVHILLIVMTCIILCLHLWAMKKKRNKNKNGDIKSHHVTNNDISNRIVSSDHFSKLQQQTHTQSVTHHVVVIM